MQNLILQTLDFITSLITKAIYTLVLTMTLLGLIWLFKTFAIPYIETLINI